MAKRILTLLVVVFIFAGIFAGCAGTSGSANDTKAAATVKSDSAKSDTSTNTQGKKRVYYYVAPYMGHPYIYDQHLGFKYAAEKFGVEIIKSGPDGWDTKAATEAFEQAIAKKPDGIVTVMWDGSLVPAVKEARAQGIPVIVIETAVPNHGANTYIGLDNYQTGVETAQELVKQAGDSGNLIIQGNWGASNTDAKRAGLQDYLKANTKWQIVADVNDESNTEKAIAGAKDAINSHKDVTAFVGLTSASGPGIAQAMEELNLAPGKIKIVCNDREDLTLEYIKKGFIQASLANKTAMQAFLAIELLEGYNSKGFGQVPVSSDNAAAGINPFPVTITTGNIILNKDNVDNFDHSKMGTYDTTLYH